MDKNEHLKRLGYEFCMHGGDPNISKPQQVVSCSSLWWRKGDGRWHKSEERSQHKLVERLFIEEQNE